MRGPTEAGELMRWSTEAGEPGCSALLAIGSVAVAMAMYVITDVCIEERPSLTKKRP
jgi:hypothetical protein